MAFTRAQLTRQTQCKLPHDGSQGKRIHDLDHQKFIIICNNCLKEIQIGTHKFDLIK